ncbi:MAG: DUF2200 domain-containing protein [Oscillospiraceae bacterium]|nr:DUF2200 domain-containing protein [Oscillospiraceae bacterium]
MPRASIFDMKLSKVYPLLVAKAEKKGRSKEEVDRVTEWLTGHDMSKIDMEMTYGDFFRSAPCINPNAELITGKICGVRVEDIEDPLMQNIRRLDKLVDELAKGRAMEKVLRTRAE